MLLLCTVKLINETNIQITKRDNNCIWIKTIVI